MSSIHKYGRVMQDRLEATLIDSTRTDWHPIEPLTPAVVVKTALGIKSIP